MGKSIVALEVTEESVRAAELSVGRKPQMIAYGEVPLPPEAARDSEVLDAGTVAVALRQLWTGARFKSKDVVLGVASRRILVREYTTQAMRPDLLREALPYQVQDLLPVPASQAVLDFFPLSQEGDQISGLLVAAVSESIEDIISTLSKVKLRVQAVDLTAFGLARATAPLAADGATVATIHIGDHTTQVVVSRAGIPLFVRILPIDVATAATRRHSEEAPLAEPALEMAGSNSGSARTRGGTRAAQPPGVSELAARVRSTLAFFASRPGSSPIARVFVTGAGAVADGVVPSLDAAIDAELRVVGVADIVAMSTPPPGGDVALNLVGTVGIALGEVRR
jgi:type IV pilus assembly protein PilM